MLPQQQDWGSPRRQVVVVSMTLGEETDRKDLWVLAHLDEGDLLHVSVTESLSLSARAAALAIMMTLEGQYQTVEAGRSR